jgi:uncharacterized membrane protein
MLKQFYEQHPGKTVAIGLSLFFAIIYLFFGFWDMLFVALLLTIGYNLGTRYDAKTLQVDLVRWLAWLNDRLKLFR